MNLLRIFQYLLSWAVLGAAFLQALFIGLALPEDAGERHYMLDNYGATYLALYWLLLACILTVLMMWPYLKREIAHPINRMVKLARILAFGHRFRTVIGMGAWLSSLALFIVGACLCGKVYISSLPHVQSSLPHPWWITVKVILLVPFFSWSWEVLHGSWLFARYGADALSEQPVSVRI